MANVTNMKRIKVEDFPKQYQDLVSQLSFILNPFMEQLIAAFAKGIDFTNLNQELTTVKIQVDGTGTPIIALEVKSSLKTKIQGVFVISASNLDDTTPISAAPFVVFSPSSAGFKITQVTGLPANKNFNLNLIVIG